MVEFDFELGYNPGKHNVVANALSKNAQLGAITDDLAEPVNSQVELSEELIGRIKRRPGG